MESEVLVNKSRFGHMQSIELKNNAQYKLTGKFK